jgi:ribosomal RNA-processing protein 36
VCVCLCVQDSQKLAEKVKEEKRSSEREQRKGETQLQKEGKKPFFLKKSVRRQLELAKRYKELKESGRLEKYLARKRKRNAQRDRRQLPFKRH